MNLSERQKVLLIMVLRDSLKSMMGNDVFYFSVEFRRNLLNEILDQNVSKIETEVSKNNGEKDEN